MKHLPHSNGHGIASGKYDSSGSRQSIDLDDLELSPNLQTASLRRYPSLVRGVLDSWRPHCLISTAVHTQ